MELKERVFLVSGGGSGLGAATVRRLVAEGARVVIADLDGERGAALAVELGDVTSYHSTDVREEAAVGAAISMAVERFGRLDGAVCCAGIGWAEKTIGRESVHALASFRRVIEVNLLGTFNVARLAAAQMARQPPLATGERGVIVCTASIAAFEGQMGQVAYAASKGGVVGMTLPLARDLARLSIRVMTIAPGLFETPLLAGLPVEVRTSLGQEVPFPSRLGHPDEFASLVVQIAQNEMLNGSVIRLDGALRMPPK
jgi:NAD(P)-dependent dehydrogenase (short-subunit alcohol dehydrogenase family)